MWSVREALQHFIDSLELTPKQQETVVRQQTAVRECLIHGLEPKPKLIRLSGSYSRNTAIRPLHDIDLFAVLGEIPAGRASSAGSLQLEPGFKQIQQVLKQKWDNKQTPRLQRHSVHIGFTDGVEFDVVPAYQVIGREEFLIHERETGTWIRTNPEIHQRESKQANERAGKKLKPLLKAIKHWNREHGSTPLRSFHLEVMSYSAFRTPPRDYIQGLELLFSHLSQQVLSACPDPARLGPNLDHLMTPNQRQAAHQMLGSAARQMRLVGEECDSKPESAHDRLIDLFKKFYRRG